MTVIRQDDLIQSVADALQYISYYHPVDFIQAMHHAYEHEQNKAAKDAIAQILINSRMCAMGHRPICQDTGIRINSIAIYFHISVVDNSGRLITATLARDENGHWKLYEPELPGWFIKAEPELGNEVEHKAGR